MLQDKTYLLSCLSLVLPTQGIKLYRKIHCLTNEFHVKFHAKNSFFHWFFKFVFFLNRIAKARTWAKLYVFSFCEPHQCANNGNSFKVNVNAFSRSSECFEWLSFWLKIWQTFIFCKFVHFQGVFS